MSPTPASPSLPTSQPLHRAERLMALMDELLRDLGYAGFGIQLHVRFAGRCDAGALRTAIARLSQRFPVTTSRLDVSSPRRPKWVLRPGAVCPLLETASDSAGDAAVVARAETLLSTPRPLAENDPIQFELLHLADGTDALMVQYNHVLMDSNGAPLLLAELHRLAVDAPGASVIEGDDYRAAYLRRHTWMQRLLGAARALRHRARWNRCSPVMLARRVADPQAVPPVRILLRSLDSAETRALGDRIRRETGFRGISLALLVSAFRSLRDCVGPLEGDAAFLSSVGVNLRDPGAHGPLFRTLASLLRFGVRPGELDNRFDCIRRLNATLRDHLRRHLDVGTVQLTSLLDTHSRRARQINQRAMLQQQSLTYGYFGTTPIEQQGLCGTPIARLYHVVQCWSPPGLALVANESQGQLQMSISYTPATVAEATARRFAEGLVDDLRAAIVE